MIYKKIKLIGGGRWALILLNELLRNFINYKVDLFTDTLISKNKTLNKFIDKNKVCLKAKDIDKKIKYEKIIIASHSLNHLNDLRNNIKLKVPILIEKPIFCNFNDYKILDEFSRENIIINLEYFNAYYIEDFKEMIDYKSLKKIEIIWMDPLIEKRIENYKYSEIFTSVFHDQLLHIMSLLKRLGFDGKNIDLKSIEYSKKTREMKLKNLHSNVEIKISFSRFYNSRERKIIINNNEMILDFNNNPLVYYKNQKHTKINKRERLMPVAKTLKHFLNNTNQSFSLSLKNLIGEIEYCFKCEEIFLSEINNILKKTNKTKFISTIGIHNYSYYLGILYYKSNSTKVDNKVHYKKGFSGIKELIRWGSINSILDEVK